MGFIIVVWVWVGVFGFVLLLLWCYSLLLFAGYGLFQFREWFINNVVHLAFYLQVICWFGLIGVLWWCCCFGLELFGFASLGCC